MAIDVLKLYEEATNGGDKGKSGICKEIVEETVKVLKVLKEKKIHLGFLNQQWMSQNL